MKDPKRILEKLVSLKRRKSEQDYRAARLELDRLEARAKQLEDELKALDLHQHGFNAARLAYRHGYVQNLVGETRAQGAEITQKGLEFEVKREALKRTLDSEDRIKRNNPKRRQAR